MRENLRYEKTITPDIDNILKVILDALCGTQGVIINDCQVQHISCSWIDWINSEQKVIITIRYVSDEWVYKDGLVFVKFTKNLCMPMNMNLPIDIFLGILDVLERQFKARDKLDELGVEYEEPRRVMSLQRVFHVGHLRGFTILDLEEAKRKRCRY